MLLDLDWNSSEFDHVSLEAKDLLQRMLVVDPEKRINAREIKRHPFFRDIDWNHLRETKAPFIPNPENRLDTSYFDIRNNRFGGQEALKLSGDHHHKNSANNIVNNDSANSIGNGNDNGNVNVDIVIVSTTKDLYTAPNNQFTFPANDATKDVKGNTIVTDDDEADGDDEDDEDEEFSSFTYKNVDLLLDETINKQSQQPN